MTAESARRHRSIFRTPGWLACLAALCAFASVHGQAVAAGGDRNEAATVSISRGDTRLMRPSALLTPLRPGETIRSGDRVLTGTDGHIELRFVDGAVMAIQPDSDFKVEAYRYDTEGERSFLALAKGALRTVSGAIGKRNRDDYRLNTPTATIGIRGTEYEAIERRCVGSNCSPEERPGLTVNVIRGRVAVTNAAGTTEVPEGQTLYVQNRQTSAVFGTGDPAARRSPAAPRPPGTGTGQGQGQGQRSGRLIEKAPALY